MPKYIGLVMMYLNHSQSPDMLKIMATMWWILPSGFPMDHPSMELKPGPPSTSSVLPDLVRQRMLYKRTSLTNSELLERSYVSQPSVPLITPLPTIQSKFVPISPSGLSRIISSVSISIMRMVEPSLPVRPRSGWSPVPRHLDSICPSISIYWLTLPRHPISPISISLILKKHTGTSTNKLVISSIGTTFNSTIKVDRPSITITNCSSTIGSSLVPPSRRWLPQDSRSTNWLSVNPVQLKMPPTPVGLLLLSWPNSVIRVMTNSVGIPVSWPGSSRMMVDSSIPLSPTSRVKEHLSQLITIPIKIQLFLPFPPLTLPQIRRLTPPFLITPLQIPTPSMWCTLIPSISGGLPPMWPPILVSQILHQPMPSMSSSIKIGSPQLVPLEPSRSSVLQPILWVPPHPMELLTNKSKPPFVKSSKMPVRSCSSRPLVYGMLLPSVPPHKCVVIWPSMPRITVTMVSIWTTSMIGHSPVERPKHGWSPVSIPWELP